MRRRYPTATDHVAALDHGHPPVEFRGGDRGLLSTRSGAEDQDVEVTHASVCALTRFPNYLSLLPMDIRFLDRTGGRLAYELNGPPEAPLAVLAHGMGDTRATYRFL